MVICAVFLIVVKKATERENISFYQLPADENLNPKLDQGNVDWV